MNNTEQMQDLKALIIRYHDIVNYDYLHESEKPLERYLSSLFETEDEMYDYFSYGDELPPAFRESELNRYYNAYYAARRGDSDYGQLPL